MKKKIVKFIPYALAAILLVTTLMCSLCSAGESFEATMCIRDYMEVLC